jgi:hypothetical protein
VRGTGSDLRVIGRKYPELALSFNTVGCEVCMINGKNCGKKPRNLLKNRDAQKSKKAEIAPNWNVIGT